MKVADGCARSVTTAQPRESSRHAARRMLRQSVGTLIDVLETLVEEVDAIGRLLEKHAPVHG